MIPSLRFTESLYERVVYGYFGAMDHPEHPRSGGQTSRTDQKGSLDSRARRDVHCFHGHRGAMGNGSMTDGQEVDG